MIKVKEFPENIQLNCVVEKETDPMYKGALAINDPDPDDDDSYRRWIINVYLKKQHYRKNVSYKRVAQDINNLFLLEYICAITRKNTKDFGTLCEGEEPITTCPCGEPLLRGMRLEIK